MALVLICGQPCSGKSLAAQCLKNALLAEPSCSLSIRIIDEPALHLERNVSYADMPAEKNLRGLLRSEVDRALSKDTVVILDSLNNIKGYRYELWCLARASGIRYCVLFCDVDESFIKEWNQVRQERGEASYNDKILDDLIRRFEKPEKRNRWDSPLFELKPSNEQILETSPPIQEAVSFLTKKIDPKSRDVQILQPTIATQNVRMSQTNSLYEVDCATQDIINAIINSQSQGYGDYINNIDFGEGLPKISVNRAVGLPELRRLRRTFIKLAGQASLSGPPPSRDAQSIKRLFIDYLNQELGSA